MRRIIVGLFCPVHADSKIQSKQLKRWWWSPSGASSTSWGSSRDRCFLAAQYYTTFSRVDEITKRVNKLRNAEPFETLRERTNKFKNSFFCITLWTGSLKAVCLFGILTHCRHSNFKILIYLLSLSHFMSVTLFIVLHLCSCILYFTYVYFFVLLWFNFFASIVLCH